MKSVSCKNNLICENYIFLVLTILGYIFIIINDIIYLINCNIINNSLIIYT